MHLFRHARQPTAAIRLALAAMLLALGLNTFAHANHSHDDGPGAATVLHAKACGYCSTFGALADAPRATVATTWALVSSIVAAALVSQRFVSRRAISAQPRAPPRN